jgi:hypothetical protein
MRKNTNDFNYADSVEDGQATHYAGNFYYKHLFDVWESQRESILGVNDLGLDQYERLKHLENWYDLLLLHCDMIEPQLNDDEKKELAEIKTEITDVTDGAEMGTLVDQPDKLQSIKKHLRGLRAKLWAIQFTYGMMMPNKKEKEYGKALA